jgi:hypothetical protein
MNGRLRPREEQFAALTRTAILRRQDRAQTRRVHERQLLEVKHQLARSVRAGLLDPRLEVGNRGQIELARQRDDLAPSVGAPFDREPRS